MFFKTGLFFLVLSISVAQENMSLFMKTNVIQNACEDESFAVITAKNSFDCGKICTENTDCRRYLFCSSKNCSLYDDGEDCAIKGDSTYCSCYKKDFGRIGTKITCPLGYFGDKCQNVSKDCEDAKDRGMGTHLVSKEEGKTFIKPKSDLPAFEVKCLYIYDGGTTILSRASFCNEENYNRSLSEYEEGFGSIYMNRWIGFTKLLAIMNGRPGSSFKIQVLLMKSDWQRCSSFYMNFKIGNKSTGYVFSSSKYAPFEHRPSCGDSMLGNLTLTGRPFSTYDSDHTGSNNCPARFGGGWWFTDSPDCTKSFLTGTFNANIWLDDLSGEELKWSKVNLLRD